MDPKTQDKLNSFYEYVIIFVKFIFVLLLFGAIKTMAFSKGTEWIFLDYANFAIHEGGHYIFSLFSTEPWTIFGGTLTQLLVPVLLFLYFLIKRNKFALGFCIFWLGDNFVNISPYIGDARCQCLDITGTIHDWSYILGHLNLLDQDAYLASIALVIGVGICFLAIIFLIVNICKDLLQKISHS